LRGGGITNIEEAMMASPKPLTALQRARRKKIRSLIRNARETAKVWLSLGRTNTAQLLDDFAGVAEKYLKTTNRSDE